MAEYRYWPNKKNPKYVEHSSMHSGIVISKVKLKLINMEDSEAPFEIQIENLKMRIAVVKEWVWPPGWLARQAHPRVMTNYNTEVHI